VKKILAYLITASASVCFCQQQHGPFVQSPDVHPDGSVSFRLWVPNAHNVSLNLEGRKDPIAMQKGEQGLWSITINPLAPEIYGYFFEADGMHLLDPSNTVIKPNQLSLSNLVVVPGTPPRPWEITNIPHGIIDHHFFHSTIVGDNRGFYVYTPPGYNPDADVRYPVLYLLHGYSDSASAWTQVGKANLILDTLIAEGKAKPMIIVMPLGYGAPEIVQRNPEPGGAFHNEGLREKNFNNFQASLIDEVMPRVNRMYRVNTDRDATAIAGLSMGGAESLLTGLNRLDKFSWAGAFSAGGLGTDLAQAFPHISAADNQKLHLLWIACGTDDRLITTNRTLIAWLKRKGIQLTQIETPGMHTWMVWRGDLVSFAPLLFNNGGQGR
jgi:enterochelin esterase-like enzyme